MVRNCSKRRERGRAELRLVGEKRIGAGEVLLLSAGTIHSVVNDGDRTSLSLHVYGRHLNRTGRLQFDPELGTASPFVLDSL